MPRHHSPEHRECHHDHDNAGAPCNAVPQARVFVLAHEVGAIDKHQHEDDDYRQGNAVEHLRQDGDVDELRVGQQNGERSATRPPVRTAGGGGESTPQNAMRPWRRHALDRR